MFKLKVIFSSLIHFKWYIQNVARKCMTDKNTPSTHQRRKQQHSILALFTAIFSAPLQSSSSLSTTTPPDILLFNSAASRVFRNGLIECIFAWIRDLHKQEEEEEEDSHHHGGNSDDDPDPKYMRRAGLAGKKIIIHIIHCIPNCPHPHFFVR